MAAKNILSNLSLSGPSHLSLVCRSISAWSRGRGAGGLQAPHSRECSGLSYYRNMQDSLLEIYSVSGSATEEGPISVTRFMNVRTEDLVAGLAAVIYAFNDRIS